MIRVFRFAQCVPECRALNASEGERVTASGQWIEASRFHYSWQSGNHTEMSFRQFSRLLFIEVWSIFCFRTVTTPHGKPEFQMKASICIATFICHSPLAAAPGHIVSEVSVSPTRSSFVDNSWHRWFLEILPIFWSFPGELVSSSYCLNLSNT